MELTDKLDADAVIDFVSASKTVETDMQFLRRRARLVLGGTLWWRIEVKFSYDANKSIKANWIIYWNSR